MFRSVPQRRHGGELCKGVGGCQVQGSGEKIVKHRETEDDATASRSFEDHHEW